MNRSLRVLREKSSCSLWFDFSAASLGTEIDASQVQPGDFVYFHYQYTDQNNNIVTFSHVAIVKTPASDPNNIMLIQALGIYSSPFDFQITDQATVGATANAILDGISPQPTLTIEYRRLPSQ